VPATAHSTIRRVTELPGIEHHPHARAVLGAALAPGGRPSHAYLLHGPAGAGKRAVARAFAAELLADGAPEPDAVRARVGRGAHPDLAWVVPSGAHEMRVDDIAESVVAAAARTPFEARRRVFVLEAAETLNDQAANRLLKTLEEPADYAHLILIADRLGEVLPTIASRCQLVRFEPLPAVTLAAQLERDGVPAATALASARLARGDGGRARMLAGAEGVELRAAVERLAGAALAHDLSERPWLALLARAKRSGEAAERAVQDEAAQALELAAKADRKRVTTELDQRAQRARRRAQTGELDLALELAGAWFRDLACVADGAPELAFNSDRAAALAEGAAGHDAHVMREAVDLVEDTRRRLKLNVSEELACEALASRLARALDAAPTPA